MVSWTPSCERLTLTRDERDGRIPGSFIVVQPKFPIHYVDTLAPAAAAPCLPALQLRLPPRRSRCSALPAHLLALAVTSTRLSPFSALGSSERETDDRVGSESSPGSQVGGRRRMCRPSVCPIDITTVIKVRLRARERAWGRAAPHEQETSKIGLNDGRWPRLAPWSGGRSVDRSESPRQIDFCLGQETALEEREGTIVRRRNRLSAGRH